MSCTRFSYLRYYTGALLAVVSHSNIRSIRIAYLGDGYVVMARSYRQLCVYRYRPGKVSATTWIDVASLSALSHRFIGQPFASGGFLYLLECANDSRAEPTGRLFRICMDRGSVTLVDTHADKTDDNFPFGDAGRLPEKARSKHLPGRSIARSDQTRRTKRRAVVDSRTERCAPQMLHRGSIPAYTAMAESAT